MPATIESLIKARGLKLGFSDLRITKAVIDPQRQEAFDAFLQEGRHGSMNWLVERAGQRRDPKTLWPEVKSVVVCAMNYGPKTDPLANLKRCRNATISVYAQNRDYHEVIKGKLKEIAGLIAKHTDAEFKVFVDTAPVLEKPLAERAGIGWQGKHTNLVSRHAGSWLFLGEIFTSAELTPDEPETDHCGQCRRCLDICPTNAFPKPYQLDARRCISYLTIEHKGPIARPFRKAIGNRIYGCDDCLAVCPWNKFAHITHETKLKGLPANDGPALAGLLALDDPTFRQRFQGSPIKRIGRDRFLRNCLIAAGNSASQDLIEPVQRLLNDPAAIVRGAAVWALSQLLPDGQFQAIRASSIPAESDPQVRLEWEQQS